MKFKLLFYKQILYIFLLTITLLKIFFSTTFLYADSFDIKNIEISKKFDINFQKKDVINSGFKIGFKNLILKIVNSKDLKKLNNVSLSDIKTIVDSFSIKEEKFIDDIYYVKLDVSFNRKRIYSILEKQNVFPSLPQKKTVLFIPILIDEEKKNIVLFSENVFFQQWQDRIDKNHQLDYVLPVEDIDDIKMIKSKYNSLEDYNFESIIKKYSLNNYIISLFYKNENRIRVLSKINLNDQLIIDNQLFKNFNFVEVPNLIDDLKILYEDYWKKENQINTSIKLPLLIALDIKDDKKIENFETFLENYDLVSNFNVRSLDNKKIYYQIVFNGTPKNFISNVEKSGFNLDIKNKIWNLE